VKAAEAHRSAHSTCATAGRSRRKKEEFHTQCTSKNAAVVKAFKELHQKDLEKLAADRRREAETQDSSNTGPR